MRQRIALGWLVGLAFLHAVLLMVVGLALFLFLASRIRAYRNGYRVATCALCALALAVSVSYLVGRWGHGEPEPLDVLGFRAILQGPSALVVILLATLLWVPPILLLWGRTMRDHYAQMRQRTPRPRLPATPRQAARDDFVHAAGRGDGPNGPHDGARRRGAGAPAATRAPGSPRGGPDAPGPRPTVSPPPRPHLHQRTQSMTITGYLTIRRRQEPLPAVLVDALDQAVGFRIDCGYRELLTTLGVGTICGSIHVLHPENVVKESTQYREYLAEDIELPSAWQGHDFREAVVLATTASRVHFWCHPAFPGTLAVYDGDFDRVFLCREGFADPRLATNDTMLHCEADGPLTFDSRLDMHATTFTATGDGPPLSQVARIIHDLWWSAGDQMSGNASNTEGGGEGAVEFFLRRIGGSAHLALGELRTVEMVSISCHRDSAHELETFAARAAGLGLEA